MRVSILKKKWRVIFFFFNYYRYSYQWFVILCTLIINLINRTYIYVFKFFIIAKIVGCVHEFEEFNKYIDWKSLYALHGFNCLLEVIKLFAMKLIANENLK